METDPFLCRVLIVPLILISKSALITAHRRVVVVTPVYMTPTDTNDPSMAYTLLFPVNCNSACTKN